MKCIRASLLLIIFLTIHWNCKKILHKECRDGADLEQGIIEQRLDNFCLFSLKTEGKTVIRSSRVFDSIWNISAQNMPSSCSKPEIDFNKQSLLIFPNTTSEKSVEILRVEKLESEHKYVYSIEEVNCNSAIRNNLVARSTLNAVLVPFIPDGWTVEFENR